MTHTSLPLSFTFVAALALAACGPTTGTEGGFTTYLDGATHPVDVGDDSPSATDDAAPADDAAPSADTGTTAPADTGVAAADTADDDTGPPPVDVFAGMPPYAKPSTTARSLNTKHQGEAGLKDYTKEDCAKSGCHGGAMLFGGGVRWADDNSPAAGVEIRFKTASGKMLSVFSNADGAFYYGASSTSGAFPGHVGARGGPDDVLMSTDVTKVGCNGSKCHDGSTAYPWVNVPRP